MLVTGIAYVSEPAYFPFDSERNSAAVRLGAINLISLAGAHIVSRVLVRNQRSVKGALWVSIGAVVWVLIVNACLLGVFEALTWIIFAGFLVNSLILLGPRPALFLAMVLGLALVVATAFADHMPFPVYLYALPVDGGGDQLPLALVMAHWAMVFIGALICYPVIGYMLGKWQAREQGLYRQVQVDPLTSVLNRRGIVDTLENEIERTTRTGESLTIAMIDIDNFKSINDSYGHPCGDAVLVQTANQTKKTLRLTDALGRFGGEEFLAVLPNCARNNAATILNRLAERISANPVPVDSEKSVAVTFSGGIAQFKKNESIAALISRADKALYLAKNSGRNCIKLDTDLDGQDR